MKSQSQLWRLSKPIFVGIAAIGPLLGTLWLLYAIYKILLRVGAAMTDFVAKWVLALSGKSVEFDFPGVQVVYFVLPLLVLFSVGVLALGPLGARLLHFFGAIVGKVPLVGFIYKALSQFVGAIQELGGERKFKSVVYVEYPSPGCRLIGFVTGEYDDTQRGNGVTSVFIPTSPNPLTGFLVLIDDDKIEPSDMTVEEASKMVLSAGLVTPKTFP